jgi:hypothetical protein
MSATLDGLMATGASFEAMADAARPLGYRLSDRTLRAPKPGSICLDADGQVVRIKARLGGWILTVDGDSRTRIRKWRRLMAAGVVLEPEIPTQPISAPWLGLTIVVLARVLLALLVTTLAQTDAEGLSPLWMLTALILAAATYTSVTLVHRAQWTDLSLALQAMAPDWIPRLSRDVGGQVLAVTTVLAFAVVDPIIGIAPGAWVVLVGFLALDLMPARHFQLARPLRANPRVRTDAPPRPLMRQLQRLIRTHGLGVAILATRHPERLLRAFETLVHDGEPVTVLGPDAEFLPGTLRSNFAWDASEVGDYHFGNLMELVGFQHWRTRFGGSLDYQIGVNQAGLSSSEAAILQVARALAQGAETLVLVDALAPLPAHRQEWLLDRLASARIRVFVYSSVADVWGRDVIDLDGP